MLTTSNDDYILNYSSFLPLEATIVSKIDFATSSEWLGSIDYVPLPCTFECKSVA